MVKDVPETSWDLTGHSPSAVPPHFVQPALRAHRSSNATSPSHAMCKSRGQPREISVTPMENDGLKLEVLLSFWDLYFSTALLNFRVVKHVQLNSILVEETQQAPPCQDFSMEITHCIFWLRLAVMLTVIRIADYCECNSARGGNIPAAASNCG